MLLPFLFYVVVPASSDAEGVGPHRSCPQAEWHLELLRDVQVMFDAGVEDMWLCRACELKEEGKPPPQCCLCPVAGGALKPTTIAGLWAHAACMQWIPEVCTSLLGHLAVASAKRLLP
jgi:PHD-zinc-finger like domain